MIQKSLWVFFLAIFLLSWPLAVDAATGEANLKLPGMNVIKINLTLDTTNYALTGEGEQVSEIKSSVGEVFRTVTKITLSGSWNGETRLFTGTVNGEKNMNGEYKTGEKVSARTSFIGKLSGMTSSSSILSGTAEITVTGSSTTGKNPPPAPGTVDKGDLLLTSTGSQLVFPLEQLHAKVGSVSGEVQVSRDGGKTWKTLTPGSRLYSGDFVITGFDSFAHLVFEIGELDVSPLTNFRIDNFLSTKEGLRKAQLNLRIGMVRPRIKHEPSGRSDFAVRTPGANTSIRGSEMMVVVDKNGATTIYAIEDKTYFTPTKSTQEETLQQGYKITFAADGSKGTPQTYSASEIPAVKTAAEAASASNKTAKTTGSVGTYVVILAAVAAAGLGVLGLRRRKQKR